MNSKKNWEILLEYIYEHDDNWEYYAKGDTGINSTHPFVKNTSLNPSEAKAGYSFITRHDLIEESHDGFVQLSKKGFEVIRDQEFKQTQNRTSRGIVVFTEMLILITAVQIIANNFAADNRAGTVFVLSLVALLMVGTYYLGRNYDH